MRILIVEDDSSIGAILKANLEAEAYAVDLESDGEVGLRLALVNDYDVIVLDDMLPGRRGFEICKELRRREKSAPILFMSVQGGTDLKVQSLDEGADDYIAKPFAYAELSARIRALLRRPRVMLSEHLRVADLTLDLDASCAMRDGKRIYLTSKEFSLLHYLMRNQGQLVTRAMIFEHVWDEAADPMSNMIEAHMYNLRAKIEPPGVSKLIRTISGRGYILASME